MKKILVSRKTYKKIMRIIDIIELVTTALVAVRMFMISVITVFLFG